MSVGSKRRRARGWACPPSSFAVASSWQVRLEVIFEVSEDAKIWLGSTYRGEGSEDVFSNLESERCEQMKLLSNIDVIPYSIKK